MSDTNNSLSPKPSQISSGKFSHAWQDPDTDCIYMYFENVTVQDLVAEHPSDQTKFEEMCLYLSPDQFLKMKDWFSKHDFCPYL